MSDFISSIRFAGFSESPPLSKVIAAGQPDALLGTQAQAARTRA
jgi:hypothetical protein